MLAHIKVNQGLSKMAEMAASEVVTTSHKIVLWEACQVVCYWLT